MKLRSFFTYLALSVVVLLLIGVAGFYWLIGQTPLKLATGGLTVAPTATMFIPKNVPVMVSLLANPDRLEAFRQLLVKPTERQKSHEEITEIRKSLLANTGLNYERDIQPWLGNEITWAMLAPDVDEDLNNGEQLGYLMALATKDAQRSREILEVFWQQQAVAGLEVLSEQYQGVKLVYRRPFLEGDLSPSLVTAVVSDRFVLMANSPGVIRQAINNVQAAYINLEHSENYTKALQTLTNGRLAFAYFNLGDWRFDSEDPETDLPTQPNLAVSLGLTPQGLLAETALVTATGEVVESKSSILSEPVAALKYISNNSPLAIAGKDLNQLWQQVSDLIQANPQLETPVNQLLADIQRKWGLDLPEDVLKWVTGEYALALFPRPDQQQPDWVFVAERSPEAQAAIQNLDLLATAKGYSVGSFDLNDHLLTAWTQLKTLAQNPQEKLSQKRIIQAQAKGVHTTVDNYEIFTTSVEAMDEALQAAEVGSLETNPDFQSSLASLPASNDGYFYLNWANSQRILKQQIPLLGLVELSAKPIFEHLKSFTITSTGTVNGVKKASVLIRLNS